MYDLKHQGAWRTAQVAGGMMWVAVRSTHAQVRRFTIDIYPTIYQEDLWLVDAVYTTNRVFLPLVSSQPQ